MKSRNWNRDHYHANENVSTFWTYTFWKIINSKLRWTIRQWEKTLVINQQSRGLFDSFLKHKTQKSIRQKTLYSVSVNLVSLIGLYILCFQYMSNIWQSNFWQERDFTGEPTSCERRRQRTASASYSRTWLQVAGVLFAARWWART